MYSNAAGQAPELLGLDKVPLASPPARSPLAGEEASEEASFAEEPSTAAPIMSEMPSPPIGEESFDEELFEGEPLEESFVGEEDAAVAPSPAVGEESFEEELFEGEPLEEDFAGEEDAAVAPSPAVGEESPEEALFEEEPLEEDFAGEEDAAAAPSPAVGEESPEEALFEEEPLEEDFAGEEDAAAAPSPAVGEESPEEALFEEEPLEDDFADEEDAAGEDGSMDIPPVIDRPLGIDEGPRIAVTRFQLLDAPDYPELGVTVKEVDQLLGAWREQRAAEGGFTIGRLQELTEEISKYYRERGLILAQAILPVQTAEEGVVTIQIFEGRLGRVLVEENRLYDEEEVLIEPFRDLVGQPVVNARIESALLRVTDYPGLVVFGIFQPGQRVGEADLVLKVQDEQRMEFSVRLDNQGTQRTGRTRVRTVIDWNNPMEAADRLRVVTQGAYNPENQRFWNIEYFRHLGRGYTVSGFVEENTFDVGGQFAERQIEGESRNEGLSIGKSFQRSRQRNASAELAFTRKDSLTTQQNMPLNRDQLAVLNLRLDYDSVDIEHGGLNFAYLALSRGFNDFLGSMGDSESAAQLANAQLGPSRQGSGNIFAEGEFQKIVFGYTRLQTLTRHQSLLLRSDMQWSRDLLVPLEQFSMGGPESVRAYGVAELLWDQGAFLSVEYLIDAPFIADRLAFGNRNWGELLQFSMFLDYALGKVNDPLPNAEGAVVDRYEGYGGVGWSLRLNLPGTLVSRFMMAWSLGENEKEAANGRDPQIWFDMTLDF